MKECLINCNKIKLACLLAYALIADMFWMLVTACRSTLERLRWVDRRKIVLNFFNGSINLIWFMIPQRPVLWVLSKWLMQIGTPMLIQHWVAIQDHFPCLEKWPQELGSGPQFCPQNTGNLFGNSWLWPWQQPGCHSAGINTSVERQGWLQLEGESSKEELILFSLCLLHEPSHPDIQWDLSFNLPCLSITMTNNTSLLSNSFIVLSLLLSTDRKGEKIYSLKNRRKEQWGDLTHCLIVQVLLLPYF